MSKFTISGPSGRLELCFTKQANPDAPLAIVLHPHPLHGGNMDENVTLTLYKAFDNCGFNVVRFNFRGVGNSEGEVSKGDGEIADAATVLDWLLLSHTSPRFCWIGGFSFGAYIGMELMMRRPEVHGFISVSPPSNMYDFNFLAPCPISGLIVHGSEDRMVPQEHVDRLVEKISVQKKINIEYNVLQGLSHYYDGNLDKLLEIFTDYIQRQSKVLTKNIHQIHKALKIRKLVKEAKEAKAKAMDDTAA